MNSSSRYATARAVRPLLLALLLFPPTGPFSGAAPLPPDPDGKKEERLLRLPEFEALCTNGAILKMRVLDEKLTLRSPYGTFVVPVREIKDVELATRVSPWVQKKVEEGIKGLTSEDPRKRDEAAEALERLKDKAVPALLRLRDHKDANVRLQVRRLLDKIRVEFGEKAVAARPHDIVRTSDCTICGDIQGASLQVHTEIFGDQALRLMYVRRLRLGSLPSEEGIAKIPALPGSYGAVKP